MAEWNRTQAQIGKSSFNPFASTSGVIDKLGKAATAVVTASALGQQIESAKQERAQHDKETLAMTHEHEQKLALIHGATEIEKTKIAGKTQVKIAKHQNAADLQKLTAGHTHEVNMAVLNHNNSLEAKALDFNNATAHLGSILRSAQPGTAVSATLPGGVQTSLTKKVKKPKAPKTPAAEQTIAAPAAKPGASVARDPKTGRAISMKK